MCKRVKATNLSSVGFGVYKVNNTIVLFYEKWVFMRKKLLFMHKKWECIPPAKNAPATPKYFPDSKNGRRKNFDKILAILA